MGCIEMELYERNPENPGMLRYAGQRTAKEVFTELEHRLKSTGYLPDEYFMLKQQWENGREIPRDAYIRCSTDYGSSEGIYIDISLEWYDETQKKYVTENFATGKTLGESDFALDRMYLITSAIKKAFHSNGIHARYVRLGEEDQSGGCVMHLNEAEIRLLIDSLSDKLGSLTDETTAVEQLLRRAAGSIIEYINETGRRPMRLDGFDMTVLAIRDGDLASFMESYMKTPDRVGELLVYAAGRPGNVGKRMTELLLSGAVDVPNNVYFDACVKAIRTGEAARTLMMMKHMGIRSNADDLSVYGDMMISAVSGTWTYIAREILSVCTPEMIKAADPQILLRALDGQDFSMVLSLVRKGIDANRYAAEIIQILSRNANNRDYFNFLIGQGMKIDSVNYSAMAACIKTDSPEQAKLLIDNGMDFGLYKQWADSSGRADGNGGTYDAVNAYWENRTKQASEE